MELPFLKPIDMVAMPESNLWTVGDRSYESRLFNLAIQVMQKLNERGNVESGYLVKHDYSVAKQQAINYCTARSISGDHCIS